jgi:HAD superfamily hydrolase (TIGR01509 family)
MILKSPDIAQIGAPAMRDVDLIIFDCDGVLVDSELLSCGCLAEELTRAGIEIDLAGVLVRFLGRSLASVAAYYEEMLGRPMPADFRDHLRRRVRESFARSLRAIPDIETVLSTLQQPFCLASSSDLERIDFSLTMAGLRDYFGPRIFSADMVAHGKPAPDLFQHAARKMGVDPARCLVIEDSVSGVTAAKAAGMMVWGFIGGSHYVGRDGQGDRGRAALAAQGADWVFDRMTDFGQRLA